MSRKRRMFEIEMPPVDEIPVGQAPLRSEEPHRRGPMAAAIAETADSVRNRSASEAAIREENDALAHEYVRRKKDGEVLLALPLDEIHSERLVRDRGHGPDPDLAELVTSIREVGLSNPIRVLARETGGYELVQGMRRLLAYRSLLGETGEGTYAEIPALLMPPTGLSGDYRRMVDENLIRKDISFAEMGALARAYSEDPENDCPDVDKAVAVLFKSASYTKRSYIRAFAALTARLGKALEHPAALPRNLGVTLKRRVDADPALVRRISDALAQVPDRDAETELRILRGFVEDGAGRSLPAGKAVGTKDETAARRPRTTFTVSRGGAHAKCVASAGRLELRYDADFSAMERRKLERAVRAFLSVLDEEEG